MTFSSKCLVLAASAFALPAPGLAQPPAFDKDPALDIEEYGVVIEDVAPAPVVADEAPVPAVDIAAEAPDVGDAVADVAEFYVHEVADAVAGAVADTAGSRHGTDAVVVSAGSHDHRGAGAVEPGIVLPPPPSPPTVAPIIMGPPAYGKIRVLGAGVEEFYYVRQDHFLLLDMRGNLQRLAKVVSLNAFGPHPVGANVKVRPGENYFFFPVCSYQLSWARKQLKPAETGVPQDNVSLTCPN